MILMQGKGVSAGVAEGALYFLHRRGTEIVRRDAEDAEAEKRRLERALRASAAQLREVAERCRGENNDEAADLFETHAMLAEDEEYVECIHSIIGDDRCNAEYAVHQAGERFAAMFATMDNVYMQARAADIRDVSRRILDNLMGISETEIASGDRVILAADDLAPSQTIRLDTRRILGLITREGSANSHTAILARAMGIPAVCGLGDALKADYAGRRAYVDGESGRVMIDPDEQALAPLRKKQRRQQKEKELLDGVRGLEDVSLDGRRLDICCNIASPGDAAAVLENDGRGIGLFRSEFLYLAAGDYPGEEEQYRAYRSVVEAMNGRRVVIRTLDIGADKQADYFGIKREENPALGMRAIRICLNRPEVFRTQLRAIFRSSAHGRVAIMFPMITSLWEVRECKRACREVMAELHEEGIPFDRKMEIGIMIETPASVLIAGELAREVDFFSVGTNDLTQYILACDRQANGLGRYFDPHHPAVMRALKMVADAARDAGIWMGICGELAADAELLPTFLEIGVDELSVSPAQVLPLRAQLRSCPAGERTGDDVSAQTDGTTQKHLQGPLSHLR